MRSDSLKKWSFHCSQTWTYLGLPAAGALGYVQLLDAAVLQPRRAAVTLVGTRRHVECLRRVLTLHVCSEERWEGNVTQ